MSDMRGSIPCRVPAPIAALPVSDKGFSALLRTTFCERRPLPGFPGGVVAWGEHQEAPGSAWKRLEAPSPLQVVSSILTKGSSLEGSRIESWDAHATDDIAIVSTVRGDQEKRLEQLPDPHGLPGD